MVGPFLCQKLFVSNFVSQQLVLTTSTAYDEWWTFLTLKDEQMTHLTVSSGSPAALALKNIWWTALSKTLVEKKCQETTHGRKFLLSITDGRNSFLSTAGIKLWPFTVLPDNSKRQSPLAANKKKNKWWRVLTQQRVVDSFNRQKWLMDISGWQERVTDTSEWQ